MYRERERETEGRGYLREAQVVLFSDYHENDIYISVYWYGVRVCLGVGGMMIVSK